MDWNTIIIIALPPDAIQIYQQHNIPSIISTLFTNYMGKHGLIYVIPRRWYYKFKPPHFTEQYYSHANNIIIL